MKSVDDFRLRFGNKELVPIMIGGMGVDISTAELALEAARLGGVGHISDAMVNTVADRRFNAKFVKDKLRQYKFNVANSDEAAGKNLTDQLHQGKHPRPAGFHSRPPMDDAAAEPHPQGQQPCCNRPCGRVFIWHGHSLYAIGSAPSAEDGSTWIFSIVI